MWCFKYFCNFSISDCDASKDDAGCCTSSSPCALGEGDCDNDSDCNGNLVCGTDNCDMFTTAWPDSAFDCCTTGNRLPDYITTMVVAGTSKNQFLSLGFECGGIHKLWLHIIPVTSEFYHSLMIPLEVFLSVLQKF